MVASGCYYVCYVCYVLFQNPVHPTTGILAVFVALNYCDVVHVAGFGYPNLKNEKHPIHYYGYDTMKSMKVSRLYSIWLLSMQKV